MRRLIGLLLLLTLVSVLAGCSDGSGTSTQAAGTALDGAVALPAGCNVTAAELKVASGFDTVSIDSDNKFTVRVAGNGVSLHQLIDADGQIVMMGFLRGGSSSDEPAVTEISPKSTAVALAFYALGGFTLPAEYHEQLLQIIENDPATTSLAALLEAKIAASPTAINNADAEITTALEQLRASVYPPTVASTAPKSSIAKADDEPTDFTGGILINPTDSQSGVTVNIGEGSIFLTNTKRRDVAYYIYRTGYTDNTGDHVITPQPIVENEILPSTQKLNGTFGTLLDLSNGSIAYADVNGPTVSLPLVPSTGSKTTYRLTIMGASMNPVLPTWWDRTMDGALVSVCFNSYMKDFALPLFFSALFPSDSISSMYQDPKFGEFLQSYLKFCTTNMPDLITKLQEGKYKEATDALLANLAGDTTFRNGFIDLLTDSGLLAAAAKEHASGALDRLVRANRILDLVDKILEAGDMVAVLKDYGTVDKANYWDITVTRPNVRLQPGSATVEKGQKIELTCTTGLSGTIVYNWSTTGSYGYLEDDRGHSGTSFDSTQQKVRYVASATEDGKSDTVTVKAYLIPETDTSKRLYLGKATSTMTGHVSLACIDIDYAQFKSRVASLELSPSVVKPGDKLIATVTCDSNVSLSVDYATSDVKVDGVTVTPSGTSVALYGYYGSPYRPSPRYNGVAVSLTPGTHTVEFTIKSDASDDCITTTATGVAAGPWAVLGGVHSYFGTYFSTPVPFSIKSAD